MVPGLNQRRSNVREFVQLATGEDLFGFAKTLRIALAGRERVSSEIDGPAVEFLFERSQHPGGEVSVLLRR